MLRATLFALVLALVLPALASGSEPGVRDKCLALTGEINRYRTTRDLYHKWLLCDIAQSRAKQLASGYMGPNGDGHYIEYVVRRLRTWGGCWRQVGEVIAYTTRPSAQRFVYLWRQSPPHWSILNSWRYDRGGGTWLYSSLNGRTYAVYLTLDEC